ncbi:AAA-like domain-containing protein [Lachnospiraceae bacterium ZAX-1]
MRRFNVTGLCIPNKHYMVDTSEKLEKIKALIEEGFYFTINRARQYGKTTTLSLLEQRLIGECIVASISFEGGKEEHFESTRRFCRMFMRAIRKSLRIHPVDMAYAENWFDETVTDFDELDEHISTLCKGKKVVLFIDEVDKTSNNQVFLGFLGLLREKYLLREQGKDFTFHSVVLAGVNDIKTIKQKLVSQGLHALSTGEGSFNSPWNIAVKFDVDMSFQPNEISTMLKQYGDDRHTSIDIPLIAQEIYSYTSGYPFLVSRVCQAIDEELDKNWTMKGMKDAVRIIMKEDSKLFDNIYKILENDRQFYDFLYSIVIVGVSYEYILGNPKISFGAMYGILKDRGGRVAIDNQIFELILTNYFISKNATDSQPPSQTLPYDIILNDRFNMQLCLTKFVQHYEEIYHERDIPFLEKHGRLLFLTYLKPLINGTGFYHIESQLTDLRRMDIVVDFADEQFILELKIWHGDSRHEQAYGQLAAYLDRKRANVGYLVTFDFRKDMNRQSKAEWVEFEEKKIFDVIV